MRAALLVLAALSLLTACGKDSAMASPTTVELDASSGRPNPTWTLSPEEEAELETRLRELVPVERGVETPGLGYRGFVLESPGRQIRVYGGTLALTGKGEGGATQSFADSNGLEKWLTDLATKRGHGQLVTPPS